MQERLNDANRQVERLAEHQASLQCELLQTIAIRDESCSHSRILQTQLDNANQEIVRLTDRLATLHLELLSRDADRKDLQDTPEDVGQKLGIALQHGQRLKLAQHQRAEQWDLLVGPAERLERQSAAALQTLAKEPC